MLPFCAQCLVEQRALVPSVIFDATKQDLVSLGLKPALADRFEIFHALSFLIFYVSLTCVYLSFL